MSILLPSSGQPIAARGKSKWHQLEQPKPFIEDLITGDIDATISAEAMNAMVSGIPSPWARAKLFHSSFGYANANNNNGLGQFCNLIVGEWKGLLALLALYPGRITFRQAILNPNNMGNNPLDLKNAMGRMLFEEMDLWTNPQLLRANDPTALPFVQMIYYNDNLVGFVSPYTLVCTAAEYNHAELEQDINWFRKGKLNDPMPFIGNDRLKLQKLHLLVNNIRTNIAAFEEEININRANGEDRVNFMSLRQTLTAWVQQIGSILGIGTNVQQGTLSSRLSFVLPYYDLFNIHQYLWYNYANGTFSRVYIDGAQKFDVRELLLDSPYLAEFSDVDVAQPLENSSINYLKVTERNGKKRFYALPLSHLGLIIFQNNLADILTVSNQPQHALSAEIRDYKLIVRISLCVGNVQQSPIEKEYTIVEQTGTTPKCILWPNFYSVHWTRYYLYSELPRNAAGFKLFPYFRDVRISEKNTQIDKLLTFVNNNTILDFDEASVKNLIKYPAGKVDNSNHKYELIQSNKPIAGIEVRVDRDGLEYTCGTMPLKLGQDPIVKNLSNTHTLQDTTVKVGIDFGSNNTCISFYNNGDIKPILFKNRRVFLIGTEVIDTNNAYFAQPHELLFFQNEEPKKGQIKSWIQKPDERFIPHNASGFEFAVGNPVFEPNIEVKTMEEFNITTIGGLNIEHNLKWQNDAKGMTSKEGFMKTLFMKICAELYFSVKPNKIIFKWAYPSALSDKVIYKVMYDNMIDNIPISDEGKVIDISVVAPTTESQAVCNYAVQNAILEFNSTTMMIGIDVGGSTSDILLVSNVNGVHKLIQQSSARLAAGKLASVIENSNTFAQTVSNFAATNEIPIQGIKDINQKNSSKAPYYLNAMFDRIQENREFVRLYKSIYQNGVVSNRARPIFAIPVYITGVLMYYSGKMIGYAMLNNPELNSIKDFNLYSFGKGGRLFDWLGSILDTKQANNYYEKCLKAGINKEINGFTFNFSADTRDKIKSEVSEGLLCTDIVNHSVNSNVDLFGEEGFSFKNSRLDELSIIDKTYYKELGSIEFPKEFTNFKEFLKIYLDVIGEENGNFLRNTHQDIENEIPNIGKILSNFIRSDRQYKIACENMSKFSYSQPMFILTAMSFLDKVIIPLVQKETA